MRNHPESDKYVLLSVCFNNAAVHAFERGDLDLAIRYLSGALHPEAAITRSASKDRRIPKKLILKAIKNQSNRFAGGQSYEVTASKRFGRRRRNRLQSLTKQIVVTMEQSSIHSYRRLFSIKASTSERILNQTSQEHLTAIFLTNIAICNHHYPGNICAAQSYYELALAAATKCGDLFMKLVVWNNLLQVYSDDLLEEEMARACMIQLESTITEIKSTGLLSKLNKHDRRGFYLNVILFSNPGTLAPAA